MKTFESSRRGRMTTRCHVARCLVIATLLVTLGIGSLVADDPAPLPGSECSDFGCEK